MTQTYERLLRLVGLSVPDLRRRVFLATVLRRSMSALVALTQHGELLMNACSAHTSNVCRKQLSGIAHQMVEVTHPLVSFVTSWSADSDEITFADGEIEIDFDFDMDLFGDGADGDSAQPSLDLPAFQKAFDALAQQGDRLAEEFTRAEQTIALLGNNLDSQLDQFVRTTLARFDAIQIDIALREIDLLRESLIEGLLAVVIPIAEWFLGPTDPADILPGYTNLLERSLLLRRALASLMNDVAKMNDRVQDETLDSEARLTALENIKERTQRFVLDSAFSSMWLADQAVLYGLFKRLLQEEYPEVQLTCEEYARYLESLQMVNERSVLQEYDRKTVMRIKEMIDIATSLLDVSVEAATEQIEHALDLVRSLCGCSIQLDNQLHWWEQHPPSLMFRDDVSHVIRQLKTMLRWVPGVS